MPQKALSADFCFKRFLGVIYGKVDFLRGRRITKKPKLFVGEPKMAKEYSLSLPIGESAFQEGDEHTEGLRLALGGFKEIRFFISIRKGEIDLRIFRTEVPTNSGVNIHIEDHVCLAGSRPRVLTYGEKVGLQKTEKNSILSWFFSEAPGKNGRVVLSFRGPE